ncbi:MAG: acyl-CoA thioesterase [Proteobacteria bacterium]|nr:acyl-CoA thioesterase [Pseudomonadota bacterium]MBU2573083.1 acyl-CoA thioesterase [Elusimicrobiota bacterium]
MKKRIYYHDTDCGGVVYYGNYLKFLEEARSEYLEELGFSVKGLMGQGVLFVVRRQEIDYKYPAVYGDTLEIRTRVKEHSAVRIQFAYEIINQDGKLLSKAVTDMVCVDKALKLRELPQSLKEKLAR